MKGPNKAAVLLSGGLDSSTCLALAASEYGRENVVAITLSYGQRHARELRAARDIAAFYDVPQREISLDQSGIWRESQSVLLNGGEIPGGTYADQIKDGGSVKTEVPFRNGVFASIMAAVALSLDPSASWDVILGIHMDDVAGDAYSDCSSEFIALLDKAVASGTRDRVHIRAPFAGCNKADIVRYGLKHSVPYGLTWSCYTGKARPCGKCATCIDRRLAFEANGVKDPLL